MAYRAQTTKYTKYQHFLLIIGCALTSALASFGANAQGMFADDTCDPTYYESLEARAWLEAQREITQNQNLIFKGDSVLEYTCFDGHLAELAAHAVDLFSENPRWGPAPGNMAQSLDNLVGAGLRAYDTTNFNHNLLGGRSQTPYDFPAAITAGSYACETMNDVWKIAKCMDFIDQATYAQGIASENDGFFTFAEYATSPDKRFLPTACTGDTAVYADQLALAVVNDETVWEEDPVNTYFELIYPASGSCNVAGNFDFSSQISTGLLVQDKENQFSPYAEQICVVPGCYFQPTAAYPSASFQSGTPQTGQCCDANGNCS